jgi:hypothetical protein
VGAVMNLRVLIYFHQFYCGDQVIKWRGVIEAGRVVRMEG